MSKAYQGMAVLRKLKDITLENSLLTIYNSFTCPHLDYVHINYHQANNGSFCQKIQFIKYQAALAIIGAIHGTSQTKLYNEFRKRVNETQAMIQVSLLFFQNTIE